MILPLYHVSFPLGSRLIANKTKDGHACNLAQTLHDVISQLSRPQRSEDRTIQSICGRRSLCHAKRLLATGAEVPVDGGHEEDFYMRSTTAWCLCLDDKPNNR